MDKNVKIILIVLALLVAINLGYNMFFGHSNLKKALIKLDSADMKLQKALVELDKSRSIIDTMDKRLSNYAFYVNDIQKRVEYIDLNYKKNDNVYKNKKDTLTDRIRDLRKDVDLTGENLPDILPDTTR